MSKFMRKNNGSIALFMAIIMLAMFAISAVFNDAARLQMARTIVQSAADSATLSVLAKYDNKLKDTYGLFALEESEQQDILDDYLEFFEANLSEEVPLNSDFSEKIKGFLANLGYSQNIDSPMKMYDFENGLGDASVDLAYSIIEPKVLQNQMAEFTKYRGFVSLTNVIELEQLQGEATKAGEEINKLEETIGDPNTTGYKMVAGEAIEAYSSISDDLKLLTYSIQKETIKSKWDDEKKENVYDCGLFAIGDYVDKYRRGNSFICRTGGKQNLYLDIFSKGGNSLENKSLGLLNICDGDDGIKELVIKYQDKYSQLIEDLRAKAETVNQAARDVANALEVVAQKQGEFNEKNENKKDAEKYDLANKNVEKALNLEEFKNLSAKEEAKELVSEISSQMKQYYEESDKDKAAEELENFIKGKNIDNDKIEELKNKLIANIIYKDEDGNYVVGTEFFVEFYKECLEDEAEKTNLENAYDDFSAKVADTSKDLGEVDNTALTEANTALSGCRASYDSVKEEYDELQAALNGELTDIADQLKKQNNKKEFMKPDTLNEKIDSLKNKMDDVGGNFKGFLESKNLKATIVHKAEVGEETKENNASSLTDDELDLIGIERSEANASRGLNGLIEDVESKIGVAGEQREEAINAIDEFLRSKGVDVPKIMEKTTECGVTQSDKKNGNGIEQKWDYLSDCMGSDVHNDDMEKALIIDAIVTRRELEMLGGISQEVDNSKIDHSWLNKQEKTMAVDEWIRGVKANISKLKTIEENWENAVYNMVAKDAEGNIVLNDGNIVLNDTRPNKAPIEPTTIEIIDISVDENGNQAETTETIEIAPDPNYYISRNALSYIIADEENKLNFVEGKANQYDFTISSILKDYKNNRYEFTGTADENDWSNHYFNTYYEYKSQIKGEESTDNLAGVLFKLSKEFKVRDFKNNSSSNSNITIDKINAPYLPSYLYEHDTENKYHTYDKFKEKDEQYISDVKGDMSLTKDEGTGEQIDNSVLDGIENMEIKNNKNSMNSAFDKLTGFVDMIKQFASPENLTNSMLVNFYIMSTFNSRITMTNTEWIKYYKDKGQLECDESDETKITDNKISTKWKNEKYEKYDARRYEQKENEKDLYFRPKSKDYPEVKGEIEYIINGKGLTGLSADSLKLDNKKNVDNVYLRIYGIRMINNLVAVYKNGELRQLAGYASTWAGPFAPLVQLVIIAIIAALETYFDMTFLIDYGYKIPFWKKSDELILSLDNLKKKADKLKKIKDPDDIKDLITAPSVNDNTKLLVSYETYLWLFVLLTDKDEKTLRAADMIHLNMRKNIDSDYKLADHYTSLRSEGNVSIKPLFMGFGFLPASTTEEDWSEKRYSVKTVIYQGY